METERRWVISWRGVQSCLLSRQMNYAIITVGLILFATGIVFVLTAQANVIENDLKLTQNSSRLKSWIDNDFNKIRKVYLMNWTNSKEWTSDPEIIPYFEKIGPFVFKEKNEVADLKSYKDLPSISFKHKRSWEFVSDLSPWNMSTRITNVNFGTLAIAETYENEKDSRTIRVVDLRLEKGGLIVTRSANELLFDGYSDINAKILNDMKSDRKLPTEYFGWFYNKNNSYEGVFEVLTKRNLNVLFRWNGKKYTKYYDGSCSEVKGGLSEIIFTFDRSGNKIFVFESDMCGSLPFSFESMATVEGLNGYKYTATAEYKSDSDTECFCAEDCMFGMLNISSCRNGLPVFMSYPISGNDSDQQNYIVIEDITGIPIEVHKTYQLNALLKPYPYAIFQKVNTPLYIPVIWYQDYWKIDSDFADHLRSVVNLSGEFKIYGSLAIILGVSLWVARGFFSILEWKRNRQSDVHRRSLLNDDVSIIAEE